jgi:hypothetical protein
MERKPTIVQITAADAPRDTIVTLLQRSRSGRGKASSLTQVYDGYLYAVIDHPGTVVTFQNVLNQLSIHHTEVSELPRKPIEATPATASSGSTTQTANGGFQRAWTGDSRVDAAMSDFLVDMFTPRTGLFDTSSFGSARVFN